MSERFERDPLEEAAAELYSPELPYHNFLHAQEAVARGVQIVEACKKEGVPIDEEVVRLGLLFHDAGYHEDHLAKGFATKEEYSATLAEQALGRMGCDEDVIARVKAVIISTHRDAAFDSNEAKVVRAADLGGLAADYEAFLDANRRLKKEAEKMGNTKISWERWKEKSKEIIGFYLGQDIRLTSEYSDADGTSRFHNRARANLNRFLAEDERALEGEVG